MAKNLSKTAVRKAAAPVRKKPVKVVTKMVAKALTLKQILGATGIATLVTKTVILDKKDTLWVDVYWVNPKTGCEQLLVKLRDINPKNLAKFHITGL